MRRLETAEDHARAARLMGLAAVLSILSSALYPQWWQRGLAVLIGLIWAASAVRHHRAVTRPSRLGQSGADSQR